MKKILLTTSALAGVVLVAGTAAAEAPTVTFTGSTDYYLRVTDYDLPTGVAAPQNGPGWDINQHAVSSELIWDVNATADNGLQFGANVQVRYNNALTTDESWIDFAGNWGRVVLGDDDGVVDNTQVGGGSALPLGSWDDGRTTGFASAAEITAMGLALHSTNGVVGESSDASKIAYYSPSFAGFSAAVSVTPDTGSTFGANNTGTAGTYHNVTEAALNYSGTFSDVGVKLHGGYVWGSTVAVGGASRDDVGSWQVGGSVAFAGFTLGLGYGDSDDSGCLTATVNCDQGNFFNAGLGYNYGAGSVGIGYAKTESDVDGNNLDDEAEWISVEGTYTVAQGLTTYASLAYLDATNGDAATNKDREATIFVLGTRVNF